MTKYIAAGMAFSYYQRIGIGRADGQEKMLWTRLNDSTRSSPQWPSGRSMTTYNVFDLRSLIWGLPKDVQLSMAANVFSNVLS